MRLTLFKPNQIRQILVVTLVLLFTSGCRTTIIYNYADWLIAWKVDDFVELTDPQEESFKAELASLFKWHRTQELPKYVVILDDLTIAISENNTDDLLSLVDKIVASGERIKSVAAEKVIVLLNQLSTDQKQQLLTNIEAYQQETHSERLENAKTLTEKLNDSDRFDAIEDILGKLTPAQKQRRDQLTKELNDTLLMRIESQKRWLSLFRLGVQPQNLSVSESQLTVLFTELSSYRSEALITAQDHNKNLYQDWSLDLLESITKRQKDTLLEVIDEYRTDFIKLAKNDD